MVTLFLIYLHSIGLLFTYYFLILYIFNFNNLLFYNYKITFLIFIIYFFNKINIHKCTVININNVHIF